MLVEFCLPILNEEEILKENALKFFDFCQRKKFFFSWKIVLISNGSTDDSLKICRELAANFPEAFKVFVLEKRGKGLAMKNYCLASQADILVYMDADLATSLENIDGLLAPLLSGAADLVIGSRLLPGSKTSRLLNREIVSRTYNLLSRLLLRHNFSDMQCGFKAITRSSFKEIMPFLADSHWFFDTELIMFSSRLGFRVKEIPVIWEEGRWEKSKSKVKVVKQSFVFLFNLLVLRRRLSKLKGKDINSV
jgi:glycosyltransferase involved in cell wall biosynthesis